MQLDTEDLLYITFYLTNSEELYPEEIWDYRRKLIKLGFNMELIYTEIGYYVARSKEFGFSKGKIIVVDKRMVERYIELILPKKLKGEVK